MAHPKRKTLYYKRVAFLADPGDPATTLESMLRSAATRLPKARQRFQTISAIPPETRFLNYAGAHEHEETRTSIYGAEFLAFVEGANLSSIELDADAPVLALDGIRPAERHEFLEGAVYFAVKGNHVVICQSKALRTAELEGYLNWLFTEATMIVPRECLIQLRDHVSTSQQEHIRGVKGITISSPIMIDPTPMNSVAPIGAANQRSEGTAQIARAGTFSLRGRALDAVRKLVGDDFALPGGITVQDVTHCPEIEVQLYLRWKRSQETDFDFFNSVATNLRNVDTELDYEIVSDSGTITRSAIKTFTDLSFPWGDNGQPIVHEMYPRMAQWLTELIATGRVDP